MELKTLALAAAREIIAGQGLQGVNARKIAGTIGYSVGSLYLIFDNLDDLILQVNGETLDDLYRFVGEAEQDCRQPADCVQTLGQAYVNFALQQTPRWLAVFEYNRSGENNELPAWFQKKIMRLFSLVEAPLQQMLPAADHRTVARHARILWGSVHGLCLLLLSQRLAEVIKADSVETLPRMMIDTYLAGLRQTFPENQVIVPGTENQTQ